MYQLEMQFNWSVKYRFKNNLLIYLEYLLIIDGIKSKKKVIQYKNI